MKLKPTKVACVKTTHVCMPAPSCMESSDERAVCRTVSTSKLPLGRQVGMVENFEDTIPARTSRSLRSLASAIAHDLCCSSPFWIFLVQNSQVLQRFSPRQRQGSVAHKALRGANDTVSALLATSAVLCAMP